MTQTPTPDTGQQLYDLGFTDGYDKAKREAAAALEAHAQALEAMRTRTIVAEHRNALERMGRSSINEVIEDKLRIALAEEQVAREAAESALTEAQKQLAEVDRAMDVTAQHAFTANELVVTWMARADAAEVALTEARQHHEAALTEAQNTYLTDTATLRTKLTEARQARAVAEQTIENLSQEIETQDARLAAAHVALWAIRERIQLPLDLVNMIDAAVASPEPPR